jgi:hypothetical protein
MFWQAERRLKTAQAQPRSGSPSSSRTSFLDLTAEILDIPIRFRELQDCTIAAK